ncbi:MAG: hypothetical protein ACQETI_04740 [Halobacteriota archaeon]
MSLFDRVADLPLTIESVEMTRHERDTSSGFTRLSTVFSLHGLDETGRGEDVTYDGEDHEALDDAPDDAFSLAGEYTFASYSDALDDVALFPVTAPQREASRHYRRWALESAGLDLALRQADTSLGEALGREYDPVRFVVSTRLTEVDGELSTKRLDDLLARNADLEFKLDPTSEWTGDVVESVAATDAVRILDLKGQYEGTTVDQEADPELYRRVLGGFPGAVVEDPALTAETEPLVEEVRDRISWDAPITGVESVQSLPFEPRWLNVKPSRFGTVESLFSTLEYADERGMNLYGGGQFELDVGRGHIQLLASLFYPDGPNDVAPGGYNLPEPPSSLPTSPLSPPETPLGMDW